MKYKKEIDALIEVGRTKYLTLPKVKKIAPKAAKFYEEALQDVTSGRISFDEASGRFGYYLGDLIEVVYGVEAYDYYKTKVNNEKQKHSCTGWPEV